MNRIAADLTGKIDFIVSTGDLVNRPTDESYQFLTNVLNLSPADCLPCPHTMRYGRLWDFPLYLLPGNHDDRQVFFHNLFNSVESERFNTCFLHKGIRFVCLDWGGYDRGVLTSELLEFAEQALSADEPAIILTHHNIVPLGRAWLDRFLADGIEKFHDILRQKKVLAIICGHLHSSYEFKWEDIPVWGLRSTAFQFRFEGKPILDLQPPHFRVVTVHDDGRLETRVVEVPLS
jgi:3',5'-cyclic AMP phosphodiesterase CpdA